MGAMLEESVQALQEDLKEEMRHRFDLHSLGPSRLHVHSLDNESSQLSQEEVNSVRNTAALLENEFGTLRRECGESIKKVARLENDIHVDFGKFAQDLEDLHGKICV